MMELYSILGRATMRSMGDPAIASPADDLDGPDVSKGAEDTDQAGRLAALESICDRYPEGSLTDPYMAERKAVARVREEYDR